MPRYIQFTPVMGNDPSGQGMFDYRYSQRKPGGVYGLDNHAYNKGHNVDEVKSGSYNAITGEQVNYETVMNQGKGVIAVQWQLEGRASGTGINYFPWDGSTIYGCYPYTTP